MKTCQCEIYETCAICKDEKAGDEEVTVTYETFEFTTAEIKALKRLLSHQYISYEDMEIIEVVRRIMKIDD